MPSFTAGPLRVSDGHIVDGYTVEVELPCINGLSAWFTLASIDLPSESEAGYTDGALNPGTAKANAHLYAASPDLYSALYDMMYGYDDEEVRKRAFAAIAKADAAAPVRSD